MMKKVIKFLTPKSRVFRAIKNSLNTNNLLQSEKKTGKVDYKGRFLLAKEEIKEYLMDKLFYSWYYPLDNIVSFIKRLLDYAPILWKDRDWDYVYMLILLKKKLDRMAIHIHKYGIHTNKRRDVRDIRKASKLLKLLIEDNFNKEAFKKHTKKWGSADFTKGTLTRSKVKTELDKELERIEFSNLWKKEDELKQKTKDEFFQHVKDNYEKWWD